MANSDAIREIIRLRADGNSTDTVAEQVGVTRNVVAKTWWRYDSLHELQEFAPETMPQPEKILHLEQWQGVRSKPQRGEFRDALAKLERDRRYVLVEHDNDNHFPYHDPNAQALRSMVRQELQPDLIVVGSDAGDFPTISRFAADRRIASVPPLSHFRKYWWPHVEQMVYDAPKALRVWIDGNHDERVWLYIEEQKDSDSLTDVHAKTIMANGNVHWLGTGDAALEILVGNALVVTHGTKANVHTAAATLDAYDRQYSVMAGHSHRPDYFTRSTKYKVTAVIGGCGCLLKPHYDRRNLHSHWQHGYQFGVVDTQTETAIVSLVDFYHTEDKIWCYVNGKVLSVTKQEMAESEAA
jgi:hypothetical protein